MPVPNSWIPNGWRACTASCTTRPRSGRRPDGTTLVWCDCVPSCLNENRCGCRLVRRRKLGGGQFGPVEMVEETCGGDPGNRAVKDGNYLYRCYCLERITPRRGEKEQRQEKGR